MDMSFLCIGYTEDIKLGFGSSDGKESAYYAGDLGSIPGSGRSPGEGNSNPLQCSCLPYCAVLSHLVVSDSLQPHGL